MTHHTIQTLYPTLLCSMYFSGRKNLLETESPWPFLIVCEIMVMVNSYIFFLIIQLPYHIKRMG